MGADSRRNVRSVRSRSDIVSPNMASCRPPAAPLLHSRVQVCPDPHKWLDRPERDMDLEPRIAALAAASVIDRALALELERATKALRPAMEAPLPERFLHNDVHAMNIMCDRNDVLLALLDWGDAGWGDPALELAAVPQSVIPLVFAGLSRDEGHLDDAAEARILSNKLSAALEQLEQTAEQDSSLASLLAFVRPGWPDASNTPVKH